MDSSRHYKIIFKKYEDISGYIEYTINLSCENDSSINIDFRDRFSRLKDLHEAFRKEADSLNFPKFPPKKLFGNKEEKFLAERRIKLQHYFNTILGSKDFSKLKSLTNWIDELLRLHNKSNKNTNKADNKSNESKEINTNLTKSMENNQANSKPTSPSSLKNHNGI